MPGRLTYHPENAEGMSPVLERNIEALLERRRREQQTADPQQKLADAVTRFTGSMAFVYLHIALYGFWIIANLVGCPFIPGMRVSWCWR